MLVREAAEHLRRAHLSPAGGSPNLHDQVGLRAALAFVGVSRGKQSCSPPRFRVNEMVPSVSFTIRTCLIPIIPCKWVHSVRPFDTTGFITQTRPENKPRVRIHRL